MYALQSPADKLEGRENGAFPCRLLPQCAENFAGGNGGALDAEIVKGKGLALPFLFGADDEARTRYLHLGKVALYQMSYTRIPNNIIIPKWSWFVNCEFLFFYSLLF